jgi:transposase-like protein
MGSVLAKCPGCQKTYNAYINYIGTGTPRFFCPDCKKRNSNIVVYNPYKICAESVASL